MQLRTCKAEVKEEERWTGFGQTKAVGGAQPVLLSPPRGGAAQKQKCRLLRLCCPKSTNFSKPSLRALKQTHRLIVHCPHAPKKVS